MNKAVIRNFGKLKRKTNRQRAWEYIRRNRVFRVGDILLILEISESSLQLLLRQLVQAKYIKIVKRKRAFTDKSYKLVRNTGIHCPSKLKNEKALWDFNLLEKVFMGERDE